MCNAVADPGSPIEGCANTSGGGGAPTYYLTIFFPENCMKMKNFGPRGAARPTVPLNQPLVSDEQTHMSVAKQYYWKYEITFTLRFKL